MDLHCPKCTAPMRHIERNGVVIDRCTECGGVFLDRGELEHLIRAEAVYVDARPAGSRGFHADDDDDDDDDYRRSHQGRPPRKKRRNFLEEIFDFG
jgi:uncharacterized protein